MIYRTGMRVMNEKHILELNFKDYKKKKENQTFWIELIVLAIYIAINIKVILY